MLILDFGLRRERFRVSLSGSTELTEVRTASFRPGPKPKGQTIGDFGLEEVS
jgi:hypothetical protein